MKVNKRNQAIERIRDFEKQVQNEGKNAPSPANVSTSEGALKHQKNSNWQFFHEKPFTMFSVSDEELGRLKISGSYRMIITIMNELKMNNPLWRRSDKDGRTREKSQVSRILKDLENAGFVIPFWGTDVYYVVPNMIRKGTVLNATFALPCHMEKKKLSWDTVLDSPIEELKKPDPGYRIASIASLFQ